MVSPAASIPGGEPVLPPADPGEIRASLSSALGAEFDREWEIVLERAKQDKSIAGVHSMVNKWRHLAYLESKDPGAYYRLLAKAEHIVRTGHNSDAGSFEDTQALIQQRLGRQV